MNGRGFLVVRLVKVGGGVLAAAALLMPGLMLGGCGSSGAKTSQAAGPPLQAVATVQQQHSSTVNVRQRQPAAARQDKASSAAKAPARKYIIGEDPAFAAANGWPVKTPAQLPGSILPAHRIVAYYGNPLSKKMGCLGEYDHAEMLRHLQREVVKWQQADPGHQVQPALHLVATVAQGVPGKAGLYRMVMPDKVVNEIYDLAKANHALLFIDIQTGHENIRTLLPRFEWILKNPDVHLGMDPEFNLCTCKKVPGTKIGTYDAADINFAAGFLEGLVKKYQLPPKVFIVHRFTKNGVTNAEKIRPRPEVQIVMNMDGWGAPWLKRNSYREYVVKEPVEYTGFKLFYHNDTKKGDSMLTPAEVLRLEPKPLYVQYQ
ncbi:MAG: hypothetical protein P4L44_01955 [Oryzomonas sp.]|uniref:hypothetical protein n=1 Tax=Oryzomonas sp. TaxID=2855186 RepID=UPI0028427E9E|nr:hypothetical protein [Oryzomonas sp.]MDR3578708.1 hypothetical protein [Oryzomonas sp.]